MSFASYDSTLNGGLHATSQAPRELGDSKKFLEIRDASRIRKNINRLQQQNSDRRTWVGVSHV